MRTLIKPMGLCLCALLFGALGQPGEAAAYTLLKQAPAAAEKGEVADDPATVPVKDLDAAIKSGRVAGELVDVTRKYGVADVLVELTLEPAWQPEAELGEDGAERQRQQIAESQQQLGKELGGWLKDEPTRLKYTPYMALRADETVLTALVRSPRVDRVLVNGLNASHLDSTTQVVASAQTRNDLGPLGGGMAVAILDSGVDGSHPFIGGRVVSEACYSEGDGGTRVSVCPNGNEVTTAAGSGAPCTFGNCGHGTHVAGIAAGADDGTAGFSGVADAADVIAIQVFHRENSINACNQFGLNAPCELALDSDVLLGLERVYALRNTFDIAAANMSLGGGVFDNRAQCDTTTTRANAAFKRVVRNLTDARIATVASTGNGARMFDNNGLFLGFQQGIGSPACVSGVISVGSVNDNDVLARGSQFSSLTTMLATGVGVNSSEPGSAYGLRSGTSMAAPHVTGAFAVLRALDPAASVAVLRDRMIATGVPVTDARAIPNLVHARLQLNAAVEATLGRLLRPSDVVLVARSGTDIDVTWNNNSASSSLFRVLAEPPNTMINPPRRANVTNPWANVTGLTPDTAYDVSVRSCDAANSCSPPSDSLAVRTLDTLPVVPANFRSGNVTTDSIEVRWDYNGLNPVTAFEIRHNTLGTWYTATVPGSARAHTFPGLPHDTAFQFSIRAVNSDGMSQHAWLSVRTLSLGPAPAAPSDLRVCGLDRLEVCPQGGTTLLWSDNASDETRYEFEHAQAMVGVPAWQAIFTTVPLGPNVRSHTMTLGSGGLYYFRVRACSAAGCSPWSNNVTYGAP